MRLITLIAVVLFTSRAFSQNFVLPDGEYMDTVSNRTPECKNYSAYYYGVQGKYPESSSSLLKEVQTFMQVKNVTYAGNGYITFRFTIDCQGKLIRKIKVLQTDKNYLSCHFDKGLVNELFAFLLGLNKWVIAKVPSVEPVNYMAFMTFKINNGKVNNIIP